MEYKGLLECFWLYMQSTVYSCWGARRGMYAWPLSSYCDTRYGKLGYLIDLIEMKKDSIVDYDLFFFFTNSFFLLFICEWLCGSRLYQPQHRVCHIGHINQDENIHSSHDALVHNLMRLYVDAFSMKERRLCWERLGQNSVMRIGKMGLLEISVHSIVSFLPETNYVTSKIQEMLRGMI